MLTHHPQHREELVLGELAEEELKFFTLPGIKPLQNSLETQDARQTAQEPEAAEAVGNQWRLAHFQGKLLTAAAEEVEEGQVALEAQGQQGPL